MMTSNPVLEINDLVVSLRTTAGRQPILHGLSLSVDRGETLCLVGESGSGKSVTSLAVMGLLPQESLGVESGSVRLQGQELLSLGSSKLRKLRATTMAMIFQEPMTALNPVMRVGRQVDQVLKAHTDLDRRSRFSAVMEMLERVGLADAGRIYRLFPSELSGGQRQRIMIAMALILKPQLLLADEPTTALDVTTQKQILALIKELQRDTGSAVIFVTHDMGVVAEIADRVAVMKSGTLVEQGPLDRVLRTPSSPYTRTLLGSVPSLIPRVPRQIQGEVVLKVSNLSKRYGAERFFERPGFVANDDINLILRRGQTLGVVGESGSGKSTLARCILRFEEPSGGIVSLAGNEINALSRRNLRPHRRRIQMIFQDPFRTFNPRRTVGASIVEGPINFGLGKEQALEQARALLEMVELPVSALDLFPHQFSGGQRQRLAIARALAIDPAVLVADEALSALDVSVQAQVLKLLERLQQRLGLAILFVTHDLRVAAQICDDIVVMQKGRVVEHGPSSQVLVRPSHEYTRRLIEAAPGRHWDFGSFSPRQAS